MEQRGRGPIRAVWRNDDPEGAISGDMGLAFPKDAEPFSLEPNQIGEGVMRGMFPDLAHLNQLPRGG